MATYYTVRALVAIAALAAGTATATTTTTTTTTATATATSTTGATLATKGGENGGDDDGDDVMVAYHPMLNVWKMARDCREGNPSVSNIHFLNHRLGRGERGGSGSKLIESEILFKGRSAVGP